MDKYLNLLKILYLWFINRCKGMDKIDIAYWIFAILVFCTYFNYVYDKELDRVFEEDFKDREFKKFFSKVNLPEKYHIDFIEYRKNVYNETWIYNNNIPDKDKLLMRVG